MATDSPHSAANPQIPHQEVELKWALEPNAYTRLAGLLTSELGAPAVLEQENRFFDTPDRRLRRGRMNLRLRRENGRLRMTCKRKGDEEPSGLRDGLARHDEWEAWVDHELPAVLAATHLPLPEPVLRALGDAPLVALGGFSNLRLEFRAEHLGRAELLALDRTDYGTRIDYELEIETDDPVATDAWWSERLRSWGVAWKPQTLTKFARFLQLAGGAA